jgi:signal transduction histidine kinase
VTIHKSVSSGIVLGGDESKLKRSIMNLVNNAMDALLDNKVSAPVITISAAPDETGKQVSIIIRDNGPGIPLEIMKTIFDPFVTRKKANGTGLGLAIVKQYITAHGGTIKVENDNGAVFTIHLSLL